MMMKTLRHENQTFLLLCLHQIHLHDLTVEFQTIPFKTSKHSCVIVQRDDLAKQTIFTLRTYPREPDKRSNGHTLILQFRGAATM